MAARRGLALVPTARPERAPDLRVAVRESIDSMGWLADSDRAMKALALRLADEIEKAVDRADELTEVLRLAGGSPDVYKRIEKLTAMCDATKTVGWLGPQLQGVLRDLGGTPTARALLRPDKPVGGRLAKLRDAAGKHDS